MLEKVRAFVSKEAVLVVAVLAAAVSCALVPFDEGYASYVDWRTLTLLFCLMAVVTGLRFMGVMRLLGSWAVSRASSMRTLAFALVALTFVSSMAVTNDVALITFVPLALVVLSEMGGGSAYGFCGGAHDGCGKFGQYAVARWESAKPLPLSRFGHGLPSVCADHGADCWPVCGNVGCGIADCVPG